MADSIVIKTEGLVKEFGDGVRAVDGVSFEIERGEIVGYLGPNGAGKTTTIKILTNLIKPTSGRALINGFDVNRHPKDALKDVGSLIGVPGVYSYLTPAEFLNYFGRVYRMPKEKIDQRIEEVLKMVDLLKWKDSKIGTFSTGMERRLAIARSIFHDPSILILDEPVLGLDPEGIKEIRELIKSFQKEDVTVFLSSHLLDEVSRVCDSVIFLYGGKVIERDSVKKIDEILKQYRLIDVELLNSINEHDLNKLKDMEVIDQVQKLGENRLRLTKTDGDPVSTAEILREVVENGFKVVSYSPERSNLEDFYVSLMKEKEGSR